MRLFYILILFLCFSCKSEGNDRVLITVKRNYTIPKTSEKVKIAIEWNKIIKALPQLEKSSFVMTDQNFGREVGVRKIDNDGDNKTDFLVLNYEFQSNEPIFTFLIQVSGNSVLGILP